MPKFSPGPWKEKAFTVYSGQTAVAEIYPQYLITDANSRLVEAAPEMYQSLYELAFGTDIRDVPNKWERARALLARIDGEDDAS